MLLGELNVGLYVVPCKQDYANNGILFKTPTANPSVTKDSKLWHLRTGNLPFSQLQLLHSFCDNKSSVVDSVCQVCPMAKQSRHPFSHSSIKTTFVFELLPLDLWGPYHIKNHNSCNQFVTIVDDYSRYTCINLIRYKSDVTSVFSSFLSYVETQFSRKVMVIRFDNAKEFIEGSFKTLLQAKGIIYQLSCSYTPQQNGVVE